MVKLALEDLTSLQSEPSALQTLAINNAKIESAFENTLSRNGDLPNQMEAPLDLNNNRLMNLAAPQSGTDAARLVDLSAISLTDTVVPAFIPNYILSNSAGSLFWMNPASIPGVGDMRGANNLSELTNIPLARTALGLGTASTANLGLTGATVGLLNGNLTFSGTNVFAGTTLFNGSVNLSGTANHRISSTPTSITQDSIGFRVPPTNVQDADYTMVLTDAAKGIVHTSASSHSWTIPPEGSVSYPGNTQILLINTGAGVTNILRGTGVSLRIAGTATDKNMSLAQHSVATLIRASANTWYIVGPGVT